MILKELLVKNNASQALKNLLNQLGVLHTATSITEFENHPHFPSFLAYSDILNGFHIESMALKLTKDQFKDLPTPFITHHNIENGIYIVVTGIENDMVMEMEALNQVFEKYDVQVFRPEMIENYNQIFTRDIGFVIDDTFIKANILPDRERELDAIQYESIK